MTESASGDVIALGYVGITATDLAAWRTFASKVLGLQETEQKQTDAALFRMDERSWRIAVEQGDDGGLAYIGLELPNGAALASLKRRLENAGVEVTVADELAKRRGVTELITATDPSGNPLEFFYGAKVSGDPFVSPTGARFVTDPYGIGHAPVYVTDLDAARSFYVDLLGFKISDTVGVEFMKLEFIFLHCNARHHSIALGYSPDVKAGLQHLMVEVDSLDTVGTSYDKVLGGAAELSLTLGRHGNDRMVSFYCNSPSGLEVELGWAGRLIDDKTWSVASYAEDESLWGHKPAQLPQ
ncbi:MAG: glyoxalase [Pseudonocardia sp.]|nr:MAG: glyoxalase [Pseudonocardia sp.]